ncbi:nucleotidyltransferase family protein [Ascidiaceihabitans sp.]|nr:nucleotidyltransferase family protein [Ascidiaceihabitans sp.]MDA9135467.1 nucleotidyltransferase family protein [Ascidiaceihabitans sp.]
MRDRSTSVMLFAAGFGTRMKHLTAHQPKPLVQVGGKALIDHSIDLARAITPKNIVANLHYLPHMLNHHLNGTEVQTITETPDVLETGGGLRNALPLLGTNPVFTMNTDAIWKGANPLQQALDVWDPIEMDALLVCVPVAQIVGYSGDGDFTIASDGRLTRGSGAVYGGIQIIKTDLLKTIKEPSFSLNVIWNKMLKKNRLFGISYDGNWCDVGHPEGIAQAEEMMNV